MFKILGFSKIFFLCLGGGKKKKTLPDYSLFCIRSPILFKFYKMDFMPALVFQRSVGPLPYVDGPSSKD